MLDENLFIKDEDILEIYIIKKNHLKSKYHFRKASYNRITYHNRDYFRKACKWRIKKKIY